MPAPPFRSGLRALALPLLASSILVAACRSPTPHRRPPVVLITLGGLRGDALVPDVAPALAAFAATSDWSGTTVNASSDALPSLATLLTGVDPWQHQLLDFQNATRRPELPTLAEVLSANGYDCFARVPAFFQTATLDLVSGFGHVSGNATEQRLLRAADTMTEGTLTWIHLSDGDLTYRRARREHPLLRKLSKWSDPTVRPTPTEARKLRQIYQSGIERLDRKVGSLLNALRRQPAWESALVVVTASHGTELGEHRQILNGENLGRETIEVPLLLKLPAGSPVGIDVPAEPRGGRVAQSRIFATVLEAILGEPPSRRAPVYSPSLFHQASAPILSVLYRRNGRSHYSLVDGDLQLHLASRFSEPRRDYYADRRGRTQQLLREEKDAFLTTPPVAGQAGSRPVIRLERWLEAGTAVEDDPSRSAALTAELRRRLRRFTPRELSPWRELHAASEESSGSTEPGSPG